MAWCLPPKYIDAIKRLDPGKLSEMTSKERRDLFSKIAGEESATQINSHFESRLLLKNQKIAMERWANKFIKKKDLDTKRDIISKIQKMDERILDPVNKDAFLEDLAAKKMGSKVSFEEVKQITDYSNKLDVLRDKISEDTPVGSPSRLAYGNQVYKMQNYIKDIRVKNNKMSIMDYINDPWEAMASLGGVAKSFKASFDNSFHGRQNVKNMYLHPGLWAKTFIKSWKEIGKELKGKDAMELIMSDAYSRPNALNGRYKAAKLDIGIGGEEAYPTSLPGKIPLLGRFFKGSESAYNGAAIRMRMDLFDRYIKEAKGNGIDINDSTILRDYGKLINSQTGRGHLGGFEANAKATNQLFFSVKFLKSNLDTLAAPLKMLGKKARKNPAKVKAAKNTIKIITGITSILAVSDLLNPGSVEWDPRSSNFGKIRINEENDTWMDITGGMYSIVTLASRLLTRSTKTSSGKIVDLTMDKYGARTAADFAIDFVTGKFSPVASIFMSYLRNKFYGNKKFEFKKIPQQLFTPISIENISRYDDQDGADQLENLIFEGLGYNISQPYKQ